MNDELENLMSVVPPGEPRELFKASLLQWKQRAVVAAINDIYELSPTKQFKDWKPQDALKFYERLKAYEARLTVQPDKGGEDV